MTENKRGKVLLVDDEPNILRALEFLVKQEGYDVVKATNGEQALGLVQSFRPDIVVLDVMMPGLDGYEVASRIRANSAFQNLSIIFLTAKGTQQDRFKGYESGGEVYMTKPFDNTALINAINEAFEFG